jgi:DNA-binding transcriptional LysR family regulator
LKKGRAALNANPAAFPQNEKHFGKGAEACHVSQPMLSVAIKKREEELQIKLSERDANQITVTPLNAVLTLRPD